MLGIALFSSFAGSQKIRPGAGSTSPLVRRDMILREHGCADYVLSTKDVGIPLLRASYMPRSAFMTCHIYYYLIWLGGYETHMEAGDDIGISLKH